MSTTTLEAVDILYQHLQGSVLFTDPDKPKGGLYRYQRPQNSQQEDVVINSLTLDRSSIQRGMLNVNLFVPNLVLPLNGTTDYSQPNTPRLKYLGKLAEQALKENWPLIREYDFTLNGDKVLPDENNQYYLNIRVEFSAVNIN